MTCKRKMNICFMFNILYIYIDRSFMTNALATSIIVKYIIFNRI